MRFAFDPEQLEFRDAARNLLEKECPASAVRAAWSNDTGRVPGLWDRLVEMGLFELDVRMHELALRLLGSDAELEGPWNKGYQFALAGPIYAGTNEIQRNVVGERVLGLPR